MMRKTLFLLILVGLAAGAVFAQVEQPTIELTNTGELRVVNALVGIGPVDIYLNERPIGIDVAPETATPYVALPPGQYVIAVYSNGADPLSVPIADVLLDLPSGQSKTAVVYETRFTPGQDSADQSVPSLAQSGSIFFLDDNRSPLALGKTRLTALHLSAGTPGKLSIAYPSRASLLHEISPGQPYGQIDIDAGVYPLTIVDADSPDLNRLAFIGDRIFQAYVYYTLIIVPDVHPVDRAAASNAAPLPVLVNRPHLFIISAPIEPPTDGIQLRVIHAAYDAEVVDVYMDGRLVAPRFSYGQYTEYIGLPAFSHLIELRSRDAAPDSQPLASAMFDINEANRSQPTWSLLLLNANNPDVASLTLTQAQNPVGVSGTGYKAFDTPGGPVTLVLVPDNVAQTARGTARVRVLHAIDGALEISLFTTGLPVDPNQQTTAPEPGVTPTPQPAIRLVDPVVYGAEANESEVPAGEYAELDFIAGNSTNILTLLNQRLLPGMVHTFVLIGQPSGEPPIQAVEIRDFGHGLPQQRLYVGQVSSETGIANVRRQPVSAAAVIGQLQSGTEVEVLGRNFDATWIKIRYNLPGVATVQEGWIFGQILEVTRLGDPINILALPEVS